MSDGNTADTGARLQIDPGEETGKLGFVYSAHFEESINDSFYLVLISR